MENEPKKMVFKELSSIFEICSYAVHLPGYTLPGSRFIEDLNSTMNDVNTSIFKYTKDKYFDDLKIKLDQNKVEEISNDVYNSLLDKYNKNFLFSYSFWIQDAVVCSIDMRTSRYSISTKDEKVIDLVRDSKIVEQIIAKYMALGNARGVQYTFGQLVLLIMAVFTKDIPMCLGIFPGKNSNFIIYKGDRKEFEDELDKARSRNDIFKRHEDLLNQREDLNPKKKKETKSKPPKFPKKKDDDDDDNLGVIG